MAEAYELLDGSPGTFDTSVQYENIYDMYQGRDPRMIASIYVPGQEFMDTTYQFQRGIIKSDGTKYIAQSAPGPSYADEYYTDAGTGKSYRILGKDGGAYTGDASKTGFNIRKFVNEDCPEEAQWKICKTCGRKLLAHPLFFHKNTSKDGFYSKCRDCRSKKGKVRANNGATEEDV